MLESGLSPESLHASGCLPVGGREIGESLAELHTNFIIHKVG